MRRSTAAAVGTLTGAALIIGVRLSVSAPVVTTASAANSASSNTATTTKPSAPPAKKSTKKPSTGGEAAADASGLKDGTYKGKSDYAYGTIQVSITVDGGKVTAADATYPITGNSGTINPNAIKKLRSETLGVKTANDVQAVSGATLTSASYKQSLQAALDSANA